MSDPEPTASSTQAPGPTAPPTSAPPSPAATSTGEPKNAISPNAVDPAVAAEATAFVRTFIKTIDQASLSGKFDAVKELYTDACADCRSTVRSLERIYSDGGRLEGGTYTNPRFTVGDSGRESILITVESTIAAYKVHNASGKVVQNEPAKPDVSNFFVSKSSAGWRVIAWT
ncbi:hypothetical protein [Tenggerimyces flavus]|uniref:Uncharacterized protein n=1 Tax=Tenggerimyces flavus TaxID=1708749 RepID=A0ABV7YMV5_9ACTN|nr:hypothetical protein [Tenggerimyces flavus]MBM7785807.1 hypothetical protein [Tenggerimyces flavus]